ncbi:cyclic nucleotide-binding-like protein, partial [Chytriomyces sp. MP71]
IFRKGEDGEEMFFIKSGKVEICSEDESIIFVTLSNGAFFGEIALFESCHRTATARAKGNCELCILTKEDFNFLLTVYPHVAEGIRE